MCVCVCVCERAPHMFQKKSRRMNSYFFSRTDGTWILMGYNDTEFFPTQLLMGVEDNISEGHYIHVTHDTKGPFLYKWNQFQIGACYTQ